MRAILVVGLLSALPSVAVALDERGGSLGIETRQPTRDEGREFSLQAIAGRWRGRVITAVEEQGAAGNAGLHEGDILIRVGDNDLYSQDDLDDVLRVATTGQEIALLVKRAGNHEEKTLAATLGRGKEAVGEGFVWDFAGPGQLDEALALAKKEGKRVVVGLSGAET